jgi:MFS transporter, PAT family, beta-lactamase induction signal transducer AmpG
MKVYLQRDVFIVFLLGFAAGLPLALSGNSLVLWVTESGLDLKTIGLFSLVGTPYVLKFLWAPVIDAFGVPYLSRRFGHRRGWLILIQLLLMLAIFIQSLLNPSTQLWGVAFAALGVAFLSATQDIVIDTFRVESLNKEDQAAGVAAYIAAYRIAMLISGAGLLFLVTYFEQQSQSKLLAWQGGFAVMAGFMFIGLIASFFAREDVRVQEPHTGNPLKRFSKTALTAFQDFFTQDKAVLILLLVILYKLADAMAGSLTLPFLIKSGYTRVEYATIVKGVGFIATLLGGFAGGWLAKRMTLYQSLWIGQIVQTLSIFGFSLLALVDKTLLGLTFAICIENFTWGIGSVVFVAYISSLCKNPLHTATQFALLSAAAAFARTNLVATSGYIAEGLGWFWFFNFTMILSLPAFYLMWRLRDKI